MLETYTAIENNDDMQDKLPPFLNIEYEVTGNPDYSMFNLSLVEDWHTSDKYCNAFKGMLQQIILFPLFTMKYATQIAFQVELKSCPYSEKEISKNVY